jgi:phosphatidylinositol 4-kinase
MNIAFPIFLGVCFPLGKGMYRVLHIPEDESVLLNSREKAPYLICVEILRCEMPRYWIIILMSCGK